MKTILQVDDDANDVFLLRHAMRKVGLTNPVQVVTDGQQAIDYLQGVGRFADRETFPFPALLLMDLKLPYVMGLDVLRWIRAQPRSPPLIVIMLTASAEGGDISEAYRLGANAFLTKPSEASKLEDMVNAIKAFWLTHNTLPPDHLPESSLQSPLSLVDSRVTAPVAKSLFLSDDSGDHAPNGNGSLGPHLGECSFGQGQPQGPPARPVAAPRLTGRQTQILKLIARGYSSRDIARQLDLSKKTVEKHRQALMDKLDIHEIATLTRYAVSIGLVTSSLAPASENGSMLHWHAPQVSVVVGPDPGATR